MTNYHKSVLLEEAVSSLDIKPGSVIVDATLGGGGHSEEILKKLNGTGMLIGFDRDLDAINEATKRLDAYSNKILINSNFLYLKEKLKEMNIDSIDGILFDLGVSSYQLDADRGFSFLRDEVLDMRMDRESGKTAAAYVNNLEEEELANIIYNYGEERLSRRVARAIVDARSKEYINSTKQLADIVAQKIGWAYSKLNIHPATRTFQAIRILVNDELKAIEVALQDAIDILKPNGKIVVISFHSLEDRIVKRTFQFNAGRCKCPNKIPICICGAKEVIDIETKKPITPSDEEISDNSRSRSSKLRVGRKL